MSVFVFDIVNHWFDFLIFEVNTNEFSSSLPRSESLRVIRELILAKKLMECFLCNWNLLWDRNTLLLTRVSKMFVMSCLLPYFKSAIDLADYILYDTYTRDALENLMMSLNMFV